ncbi:hypothetical protein DERF_010122 [Dermatophagoides farinae]|uniref:Uncharacterized protein n=1 Tax=Dermatophagoides farinae TaxID=6954 RepID=A0A922HWI1_DERFA|nr:hypothetical protein DERF_010122 [Dermatophagoides farinae]
MYVQRFSFFFTKHTYLYCYGDEKLEDFLRYVTIAEHPANLMLNTNYIHPFAESVEMTVTTPTQSYSICNGYCINVEHPNNVMASQIECRFVIRYTPSEIHFKVFVDPDEGLEDRVDGDNNGYIIF